MKSRRIRNREKAILMRKNSKMALNNVKIAVHWKDSKGNPQSMIYKTLAEAEYLRKYLLKQGANLADIEFAVVKEVANEPEQSIK